MGGDRTVCYYYDSNVGNYYYGHGHPMKPQRMRMTHNLVMNYGLLKRMHVYKPRKATFEEITTYHTDEYIKFLKSINFETKSETIKNSLKFNVGEDCPIFPGMYDFCQLSAGGSLSAAIKLNRKQVDIAINWSGGLHHAKKTEASGFCYVNDIVLAILELLKFNERVLYVDIDVHHGDGVEEAFFTTDRVMTLSFHKYGEYFPGTGDIKDIGHRNGKYYALNFPLRDGMNDEAFESIFKPLTDKVMQSYRPNVIVLQCGADSLTGDRLGCFNLTIGGHSKCVEHIRSFNLPLLLLGGGGYTIRNVARCWTKETAVALGVEISDTLPYTDYYEYYGPDFKLDLLPSNYPNMNTPEYLEKIKIHLFENLRMISHAPGVQFQQIPPDGLDSNIDDELQDMRVQHDRRVSIMEPDQRIHQSNEFYDEDSDDALGEESKSNKRKSLSSFRISDIVEEAINATKEKMGLSADSKKSTITPTLKSSDQTSANNINSLREENTEEISITSTQVDQEALNRKRKLEYSIETTLDGMNVVKEKEIDQGVSENAVQNSNKNIVQNSENN